VELAIVFVQKERSLSRLDAYSLASMAMGRRVGEMDAAEKSVHGLVAKSMQTKR
jgi:acetamidase/formamidase